VKRRSTRLYYHGCGGRGRERYIFKHRKGLHPVGATANEKLGCFLEANGVVYSENYYGKNRECGSMQDVSHERKANNMANRTCRPHGKEDL